VRNAVEDLSPEVSAALIESGIVLSGGASQLAGLAERISRGTGIAARQAASDVQNIAVLGAGKLFQEGSYAPIRELMTQHKGEKRHNQDPNREYPVKQVA
ncbi:MAG TPA: rod shape-determining protein, partial [Blastocatellia bacterium]|nr:rod shape-determining protein [Blastocatellia bacterium]